MNRYSILLILTLITLSCSTEYELQDDGKLLENIKYNVAVEVRDSTNHINLGLYNNSEENILIPISSWIYFEPGLAISDIQDEFYGVRNAIMYYKDSLYSSKNNYAPLDIRFFPDLDNWPYFILIKSHDTVQVQISISNYVITQDNSLGMTFKRNRLYEFELKLSIISELNVKELINNNFEFKELITTETKFKIPNLKFNYPFYNGKFTEIEIEQTTSEQLNLKANNKKVINFKIQY